MILFLNEKIKKYECLNYKLSNFEEIESILSTNNLIELKDSKNKKLIVENKYRYKKSYLMNFLFMKI